MSENIVDINSKVTGISKKGRKPRIKVDPGLMDIHQKKMDKGPVNNETPPSAAKPPKIPLSKLIVTLARAMNKEKNKIPDGFPDFPIDYRVCKSEEGPGVVVIEVEDGKNAKIEDDDVAIESQITEFLALEEMQDPKYEPYQTLSHFTNKIVNQFKKMKRSNLLKYPKSFGFLEDPEICFNRAWYEPEECDEDDPDVRFILDSIYERVVNQPDCLIKEYGANLIHGAPRKSCPFLLGLPNSGKSAYDFINQMLLGDAHKSVVAENIENPYGLFRLIGAKSIYFDEVKISFLQTSLFLRLTGKKNHPFNRKFKDERSTDLEHRTWMSSNYRPDLSKSEVAERVNLYLVEKPTSAKDLPEEVVKERIRKGIPKFAYIAIKKYLETSPNLEPVPYDRKRGLEIVERYRDPLNKEKLEVFREIIEAYFLIGPEYAMKCSDKTIFLEEYKGKGIKTPEDAALFMKLLYDECNLSKAKTIRRGHSVFRGHTGAALKSNVIMIKNYS